MNWRRMLILGCLFAAGCAGSGGGSRIDPPALSPDDAAQKAMADYDANKDQFLSDKELEKCPALLGALERFDKNGDKKLDREEIASRLRMYREANSGLTSVACRVLMDGRPLLDATVTFEPEAFLGSSYKTATGVTDSAGTVSLRTEGQPLDGLPYGLFRIKVSKKDSSGREQVPARYNEQTTLGQEIGPDIRGDIVIKVSRR